MITDKTLIWTERGYINIDNLYVGDKVISYNADRHCTEYDAISWIHTDYQYCGLLGVKHAVINFLVSLDHPILLINAHTKEVQRSIIDDHFMKTLNYKKRLLTNKVFEPYQRSMDLDYVEWTARLAASSSRHRFAPLYSDVIEECIKDLTAVEAQAWLTTFFHWNVLRPQVNYMKTTLMRSAFTKDMIYHVAPRAGVGTYQGFFKTKAHFGLWVQAFSICKEANANLTKTNWAAGRHEGIMYNVATRNGNFLARHGYSTFPMACKYTKEIK